MKKEENGIKNERGMYFAKKQYEATPLHMYEKVKEMLPAPFVEANPLWKETYDFAVRILFQNIHRPTEGSGFVSNFVDAAFNDDIFLWDTVFMTFFCNLLHPYVPGICSLDNFYCKQFDDGEIPREMIRATGEEFPLWVNVYDKPLYSYFHNHYGFRRLKQLTNLPYEEMYKPDLGRKVEKNPYLTLDNLNHPLLALAELESYKRTKDVNRLNLVLEPLYQQYMGLKYHLQHKNGLYVTDWASMDNSPRNKYLGLAVDITSEMALFAKNLLELMDILETNGFSLKDEEVRRNMLAEDRKVIKEAVDTYMWNAEDGFYYDVTFEGSQTGIKTIAGFAPMLAGIAEKEQVKCLVRWLKDKNTFCRIHRIPVLAANEPSYHKEGGYWSGSVWASTNALVILGLEEYGYHALAKEIALNHMQVIAEVYKKTGTIWENYPADSVSSGDSDNKDFVGWSGIGPIQYFIEYAVGLKGTREGLIWEINDNVEKGSLGCKNFWFAGRQGDFKAELREGKLCVTIVTRYSFYMKVFYKDNEYYVSVSGDTEVCLDKRSAKKLVIYGDGCCWK